MNDCMNNVSAGQLRLTVTQTTAAINDPISDATALWQPLTAEEIETMLSDLSDAVTEALTDPVDVSGSDELVIGMAAKTPSGMGRVRVVSVRLSNELADRAQIRFTRAVLDKVEGWTNNKYPAK